MTRLDIAPVTAEIPILAVTRTGRASRAADNPVEPAASRPFDAALDHARHQEATDDAPPLGHRRVSESAPAGEVSAEVALSRRVVEPAGQESVAPDTGAVVEAGVSPDESAAANPATADGLSDESGQVMGGPVPEQVAPGAASGTGPAVPTASQVPAEGAVGEDISMAQAAPGRAPDIPPIAGRVEAETPTSGAPGVGGAAVAAVAGAAAETGPDPATQAPANVLSPASAQPASAQPASAQPASAQPASAQPASAADGGAGVEGSGLALDVGQVSGETAAGIAGRAAATNAAVPQISPDSGNPAPGESAPVAPAAAGASASTVPSAPPSSASVPGAAAGSPQTADPTQTPGNAAQAASVPATAPGPLPGVDQGAPSGFAAGQPADGSAQAVASGGMVGAAVPLPDDLNPPAVTPPIPGGDDGAATAPPQNAVPQVPATDAASETETGPSAAGPTPTATTGTGTPPAGDEGAPSDPATPGAPEVAEMPADDTPALAPPAGTTTPPTGTPPLIGTPPTTGTTPPATDAPEPLPAPVVPGDVAETETETELEVPIVEEPTLPIPSPATERLGAGASDPPQSDEVRLSLAVPSVGELRIAPTSLTSAVSEAAPLTPAPPPAPPTPPATSPGSFAAVPTQQMTVPAPTVVTAPASAMSTAPQVPIYQQIVTGVAPMLRGVDGQYALMLQLNPIHLGAVRVALAMKNGEVSIQVRAVEGNTRDLVEDNLDDLRETLSQLGISTGTVDVDTGGDGDGAFDEAMNGGALNDSSRITTGASSRGAAPEPASAAPGGPSTPAAGTYAADGGLDVRV